MLCPLSNRWFERRKAALLALVLAAAVSAGCGYHVAGRGAYLPKTWHTVAVPNFTNKTLHYRLGQIFTEAMIRQMEERTSYRIDPDPRSADAVLTGELTSIAAVPVLYDATSGRATTMLVTVEGRVKLEDRVTKKVLYRDNHIVFRDEYELSTDPSTFFDERSPALDRIARDFSAQVVSGIMENF